MKQYEVTSSVLSDTIEFEDGDMNKFSLGLRDRDSGNELTDVAQWRPAGSRVGGFPEGAIIEADVKNQPRGGLKLANAKLISDTGSNLNGDKAPSGPIKTEVLDYRRDATGRSIERQVALKAAAEIAAASSQDWTADLVVAYAEKLDAFLNPNAPVQETLPDEQGTPDDDIPF